METNCKNCVHCRVCALWRRNEMQDASSYSDGDCDYYIPVCCPNCGEDMRTQENGDE